MSLTVPQLIEQSHQTALDKGWWKDGIEKRPVEDIVNCFFSEVLEAFEEYRCGRIGLWLKKDHQEISNDLIKSDGTVHIYDKTVLELVEEGWKPEGFFTECADLLIRLGDAMGAFQWTYSALNYRTDPKPLVLHSKFILQLNSLIPKMVVWGLDDKVIWSNDAEYFANQLIAICLVAAGLHKVDLLSLCELKMKYNASRSYRHGGKRA